MNVATYGQVIYRELWPGIDLVFRGGQEALEYDFLHGDEEYKFHWANRTRLANWPNAFGQLPRPAQGGIREALAVRGDNMTICLFATATGRIVSRGG